MDNRELHKAKFIKFLSDTYPRMKLISEYQTERIKVDVKCDKCGYIQTATPHNIKANFYASKHKKTKLIGCRKCAYKEMNKHKYEINLDRSINVKFDKLITYGDFRLKDITVLDFHTLIHREAMNVYLVHKCGHEIQFEQACYHNWQCPRCNREEFLQRRLINRLKKNNNDTYRKWKAYSKAARAFTMLIKYHYNIRAKKGYHIDHEFSVKDGFHNGIPIDIICCPSNLKEITQHINQTKNRHSSVTKEELLLKYENYLKTDFIYKDLCTRILR